MKAKMKLLIQHRDRTTEEIYAAPITLTVPGYSKPIMAAVDKRGNRWFVPDLDTGAYIMNGRTRKAAIAAAIEQLARAGEAAYDAAVRHWGPPKGEAKDEAL